MRNQQNQGRGSNDWNQPNEGDQKTDRDGMRRPDSGYRNEYSQTSFERNLHPYDDARNLRGSGQGSGNRSQFNRYGVNASPNRYDIYREESRTEANRRQHDYEGNEGGFMNQIEHGFEEMRDRFGNLIGNRFEGAREWLGEMPENLGHMRERVGERFGEFTEHFGENFDHMRERVGEFYDENIRPVYDRYFHQEENQDRGHAQRGGQTRAQDASRGNYNQQGRSQRKGGIQNRFNQPREGRDRTQWNPNNQGQVQGHRYDQDDYSARSSYRLLDSNSGYGQSGGSYASERDSD